MISRLITPHKLCAFITWIKSLVTPNFKAVTWKHGVRVLDIGWAVSILCRATGSVKYPKVFQLRQVLLAASHFAPRPRSSIEHWFGTSMANTFLLRRTRHSFQARPDIKSTNGSRCSPGYFTNTLPTYVRFWRCFQSPFGSEGYTSIIAKTRGFWAWSSLVFW